MRVSVLLGVVVLAALPACGKRSKQEPIASAIEKLSPSKFVLLSLHPANDQSEDLHNETTFHGFRILGSAEITDQSEQRELIHAMARGVRENDDTEALCFVPRHGLHIEQDGRSIDFTICFHCLQVEARGFGNWNHFFISASPEATFDQSIQRHHLTLAPK